MKLLAKDMEEADMAGAVSRMRDDALLTLGELQTYFTDRVDFDREGLMDAASTVTTLLERVAQIKVWGAWMESINKVLTEKGDAATMEDVRTHLALILVGRTIATNSAPQSPVSHAYSLMVSDNFAQAINTCNLLEHADRVTHELADSIGPEVYDKLRAGDTDALAAVSKLAVQRVTNRAAAGGQMPAMPPGLCMALGLPEGSVIGFGAETAEDDHMVDSPIEGTGIIDGGPTDSADAHARVFA